MKTIQYKVYDKEGKLRKLINTNKEKQLNDDEWLNGVTCFVINEKGEALIEKRVNKGLTPGKLDLCSGHVDGEETQTQAMIRELKEELGIEFSKKEAIFLKEVRRDKIPPNFKDLWLFKRDVKDEEITFPDGETTDFMWVTIDKFIEMYNNEEIVPTVDFGREEYEEALKLP